MGERATGQRVTWYWPDLPADADFQVGRPSGRPSSLVPSPAHMVAEFHAALGQKFGDGGRGPDLQMRLFVEELAELRDELEADNRVGIARELFDIVYIAYSAAFSYGIDLDAVGQVVHAANMSKRGPDGRFTL